jgi:hypothetical protein
MDLLLPHRQSNFDGMSMETLGKGRVADPQRASPLLKRLRLTAELDKAVSAGIGCLRRGGRPAAIPGFVVAVIVLTVYGMFAGWRGTHVTHEAFEGRPFRTHRNATSAVVLEANESRVPTSIVHVQPNPILTRMGLLERTLPSLPVTGSAGERSVVSERTDDGSTFQPAVTTHEHAEVCPLLGGFSDHDTASESSVGSRVRVLVARTRHCRGVSSALTEGRGC